MIEKRTSVKISAFSATLLAATSVGLVACGQPIKPVNEATAKFKVINALDLSVSDRRTLPARVAFLSRIVPCLPDGTFLTVIGFDSRLSTLMSEPAPSSGEALITAITARLGKATKSRSGTRFDVLLSELARRARRGSGRVVILIESDMLPDGVSRKGLVAIRAAAADIARNPKVSRVVIVGASPQAGQVIESAFAPLIPGKLAQYTLLSADPEAVAGGLR